MKTIILSSLLLTQLFTVNVFADTELKTSDVFVTATRTPISKNNVIADTTTINEEEIERAGSSSLTDLLQRQPGIEIYNSGGQGKVSSLHIRGSESDHVVVLIDGLRVNQITSGLTAFENIPLSQIEKIEIVRGASSSLYGAGAIGGVIQIFTKKGVSGFKPYAAVGYGRYGTRTAQAGIRAGNDSTNYALNVSSLTTDGFSALKTNDPIFNDKDGYNNLSLSGSINHKFNQDNSIGINFIKSSGNNRYDYRYDTNFFDHKNKMDTQAIGINFSNKITNDWQSDLKIGQSLYKYNDNFNFDLGIAAWTPNNSKQNQLSWLNNISLPIGSLQLMYDFNRETINKSLGYDKSERNNSGYMIGYLLNKDNHNFQANYRFDVNSAYGKFNTGNIGYRYKFNDEWAAAGSLGQAFRAPNFMDLYYPGYSNPNLKPEESKNIEASLRYQKDVDKFSITIFENKIDKFILNGDLGPENIEKAKFKGLTFSGSTFIDHFQLYGNATFQSAKNEVTNERLLRRAQNYGNAGLNYYFSQWNLGAEITAQGTKKENDAEIPGYTLINLVADYKINNSMKLNLRLNNVLNKDYALAYEGNPKTTGFAYQTPGTVFFVNLRYEP